MNKILAYFFISIISIVACNGNDNKSSSKDDAPSSAVPDRGIINPMCFRYEKNGDTVWMDLNASGDIYKAQLLFKLKEKDQNKGIYTAVLRDSILKGLYVFESEGTRRVREEFFKWEGDSLLLGRGERMERNDTMLFKAVLDVSYNQTIVLKKASCQ